MQRTYEVMFIVRPDLTDEDLDKLVSTLETQVGNAGGTIKSVDKMGKRRLAYEVRTFTDGMYVLFTIEGEGALIKEVERRLRVTEQVIKFITVRVDEEAKRIDKQKALRAKQEARKPRPKPVAPPPFTVPPAAESPQA